MKLLYKLAAIAALSAPLTFAQDSSGDSMLKGSYRFRYVAPLNYDTAGDIIEVIAAEGVIAFDGSGTYTIAAGSAYMDNTRNNGAPQAFPASAGGAYVIGDAGTGYIQNPLASFNNSLNVAEFGAYSDGVFTGSATEAAAEIGAGLNDLFVVMLAGAPLTNASFTSPYWLGVLDFSAGGDQLLKNASLKIAPNGAGGLGTLKITGFANNDQSGTLLTQTVTGATYSFASDGGATLTLPLPAGVSTAAGAMFTGARLMYVSADGNFVLGWNPGGYDIFFGVQALTAPATDRLFSGLYYLGNLSDVPEECGAESFWGSENADGMEDEIVHQRLFSAVCSKTGAVTDYGTDDYTALDSDGTASDTLGNHYAFGASGSAFVAVSSAAGVYSLTIGIHAPSFSGSGVYLNPIGVVNAASWDPITASVAPGELITLFGSGLSSSSLANPGGLPFGTALGATQVLVNGQPAPIYYVSPTQVSAIVPYEIASSTSYTAEIQIKNGALLSNPVSVYLTDAQSGIFSQGENGIGDAIAFDATSGAYVTGDHPAQPGDYITLALTGMGTVTPAVPDGAVGPTGPLSYADNFSAGTMLVFFNDYVNNVVGQQATVSYAGLYPDLAGLYQMNVQIPATVGPGEVYIEVVTDAADIDQVTICVTGPCAGSGAGAAAKLRPRPRRQKRRPG